MYFSFFIFFIMIIKNVFFSFVLVEYFCFVYILIYYYNYILNIFFKIIKDVLLIFLIVSSCFVDFYFILIYIKFMMWLIF